MANQELDNSVLATVPKGNEGPTKSEQIKNFLLQYSHVIAFIVLVIISSLSSPYFLKLTNIMNVIRGASMVGIVSIGMTIVILSRGIDLSAGSIVGVGAVSAAALAIHGSPIAWCVALLLTTFLGTVNGVLITKLKLQPFIATLAMLIFARGCLYLYSGGGDTYSEGADAIFQYLGSGYIWFFPVPVVIFLGVILNGDDMSMLLVPMKKLHAYMVSALTKF